MSSSSTKDAVYKNPTSIYPISFYLRDPLGHALGYNFATLCLVLVLSYRYWHDLHWNLLFDVGLWMKGMPVCVVWWLLLRQVCNGRFLSKNKLYTRTITGTNIVVTGASGGIGLQCCVHLARCGGNVYMGCRDMAKSQEALRQVQEAVTRKNQRVEVASLDLESKESIRKFADYFISKKIPVHILVNNAGLMMIPQLKISKLGYESALSSNHLGHFMLTNLLLNNIKACKGRVVNVSSLAHSQCHDVNKGFDMSTLENVTKETYNPLPFYGSSKLCNILFTKELQRRFLESSDGKECIACVVHPGAVCSDLYRNVTVLKRGICWNPLTSLAELLFLKATAVGAYTHVYAVLADKQDLRPGAYYADCSIGLVVPAANDRERAKALWDWSVKALEMEAS